MRYPIRLSNSRLSFAFQEPTRPCSPNTQVVRPKPNISSSTAVRRASRSSGHPCHRSLRAALAHIEGSAHLGPRKSFTAQLSDPVSVNLGARPSERLSLSARIAQTGPNPLLDE